MPDLKKVILDELMRQSEDESDWVGLYVGEGWYGTIRLDGDLDIDALVAAIERAQ